MKPQLWKDKHTSCSPYAKAKTPFRALALPELGSDKDLTNSVDELDIVALFKKHQILPAGDNWWNGYLSKFLGLPLTMLN